MVENIRKVCCDNFYNFQGQKKAKEGGDKPTKKKKVLIVGS